MYVCMLAMAGQMAEPNLMTFLREPMRALGKRKAKK